MPRGEQTSDAEARSGLKRGLGVFELTAMGMGVIIGAGIFVVIGPAARHAGGAIWLPFLLGAVAAACTGLSYAELSSAYPRASAAYEYTRRAFGVHMGFMVGWLVLIAYLVSASAVALGFAGYLRGFLPVELAILAAGLIIVCVLVLLVGVKESVWVGATFTILSVAGLLVVVGVSVPFLGSVDYLEAPHGLVGIFQATTLLFFAYLGFEQVANLGEEARNPSRSLPTAIILAVGITTVLYITVAVAAVSVVGWQALAASDGPLVDVAAEAGGPGLRQFIAWVAIMTTGKTVLFLLLCGARIMYGMAAAGSLPRLFARVHRRSGVPWAATLTTGAVALGLAALGRLELAVQLTNFALLSAFVAVNAALIRLRLGKQDHQPRFRAPLTVGRVPVPAVVGGATALFMLANVGVTVLAAGMVLALVGAVIYLFVRDPQSANDA